MFAVPCCVSVSGQVRISDTADFLKPDMQGAEAVLSAAREKVARARLGSGASGADGTAGLRTPRASIAAPGSARRSDITISTCALMHHYS